MKNRNGSPIHHLSWKELVMLKKGIGEPGWRKRAMDHAQICMICSQRKQNLDSMNLPPQERRWVQEWVGAAEILKKIEGKEEEEDTEDGFLASPATNVVRFSEFARLAAASDWKDILQKQMRPEIPAKQILEKHLLLLDKLRVMFYRYQENLYLQFLEVPVSELRKLVKKVQVGEREFFAGAIDEEGAICLGKVESTDPEEEIQSFSLEDLQNVQIEIASE